MGPSQLRRLAAGNRRLAAKLEAEAAKRLEAASTLRKQADELEGLAGPLTNTQQDRSMFGSKMELQRAATSKRVKIAAKMTSDTDAKRALLEANLTSSDVATLLGVGQSTVNAWCTGARSIPRAHVDRLREKHRIPARVWPKIAG